MLWANDSAIVRGVGVLLALAVIGLWRLLP
jgi:hypothetical protein